MKQSIGIDLDSTLNCLVDYWLEVYNQDYGDCLTYSDITNWDIQQFVKKECGPKIHDYTFRPGFFRHLKVKPYAVEITKFLAQYFDLYIITAYHWEACRDKAQWIIEHFPHINSKNIIFCNNKALIGTSFLIDDGPHNLESFKGEAILFDAPWNRFLGDRYFRAKDWREVGKFFEKKLFLQKNKEWDE
ncbi:MAG TPA: 5'-3'-deoxyribonucleotidase [Bacillota bacterium]